MKRSRILVALLATLVLVSVESAAGPSVSVGVMGPGYAIGYNNGGNAYQGPVGGNGHHHQGRGYQGPVGGNGHYRGNVNVYVAPPQQYYQQDYRRTYVQPYPAVYAPRPVYVAPPVTYIEAPAQPEVLECNSRVARVCSGNVCVICN